jgi:hypothetical protein
MLNAGEKSEKHRGYLILQAMVMPLSRSGGVRRSSSKDRMTGYGG